MVALQYLICLEIKICLVEGILKLAKVCENIFVKSNIVRSSIFNYINIIKIIFICMKKICKICFYTITYLARMLLAWAIR